MALNRIYGLWRACWCKVSSSTRGVEGKHPGTEVTRAISPPEQRPQAHRDPQLPIPGPAGSPGPSYRCIQKQVLLCLFQDHCITKGRAACAGLSSPSRYFIPCRPFASQASGNLWPSASPRRKVHPLYIFLHPLPSSLSSWKSITIAWHKSFLPLS